MGDQRRLAGHYVDLERFVQAIYESTQPFAELRSAAETLPLEFDIDTAVGVQLDAVGERVGVSRKLKTPLEGVYFAFDEDEVGFDEGVWKDDYDPSEGMVSLDDEFYRLVIKAKIAASGQAQGSKGKIVIATVKGDVHDIGKNIVRVILENYGYDVLDLGRDVPPERVVEAVRQTGAKLVGLSALMTTTVPNMQATIKALHAAKLDCKVMVGGAVLTPSYAKDIGADYYCKDAKASADLAKQLLG